MTNAPYAVLAAFMWGLQPSVRRAFSDLRVTGALEHAAAGDVELAGVRSEEARALGEERHEHGAGGVTDRVALGELGVDLEEVADGGEGLSQGDERQKEPLLGGRLAAAEDKWIVLLGDRATGRVEGFVGALHADEGSGQGAVELLALGDAEEVAASDEGVVHGEGVDGVRAHGGLSFGVRGMAA